MSENIFTKKDLPRQSSGIEYYGCLFFVGVQSRTAELVIESGYNIETMLMHDGNIHQAFSPYSRAIGDMLAEGGLISETELIKMLEFLRKNVYIYLAGILLKMG